MTLNLGGWLVFNNDVCRVLTNDEFESEYEIVK
jgi:hypothetical protein